MKIHSFALMMVILVLFSSGSYAPSLGLTEINGTEFTLLSNTDQCLSDCEAWIEWDLSKGILTNVQLPAKANSEFGLDIIKQNDFSEGLEVFGIEVWENVKGGWVKVSDNFYGFKAVQGKIYRLRIWGKRKATLEANNVDWVLTAFSQKLSQWAWWNSGWKSKFAINEMVVSTDLNTTNWINLVGVDFSTLNSACANANDLTIVNEGSGVEVADLNFQGWDGSNTDADVNVLFNLTAPLTADTYYGEYYFYSNNPACVIPTNRVVNQSSTDDFEDNNFDQNVTWVKTAGNGTGATDAAAAKEGSYGFKLTTPGGGAETVTYLTESFKDSLTLPKPPFQLCTWLKTSDVAGDSIFYGYGAATNLFEMGISGSDFSGVIGGGAGYSAWAATPANDTWYKMCIDYGISLISFTIYDSDEAFVESYTNTTVRTNDLTHISAYFASATEETLYIDNIGVSMPRPTTFAIGSEQSTGDFNISTINSLSFTTHPTFAYGFDGNVTIDFNVFNPSNNRITIDLNYSTTTTQGTGTVIIEDLNLVSTVCPDQDWDDVASECSYSWDYSAVDDGNYRITGMSTVGTVTDFNASVADFQVANDVNIVVSIPINEDTGLGVTTSAIGFSVKITTDTSVEFYDDLFDLNGFVTPIQTNPILIKVDVNVADEYYSRQYTITFEEATPTYTLQSYLAPVAESGNFIFFVFNSATTAPVEDVTINVSSTVPIAGEIEVQEIITDSAGTATIPLLLDTAYDITFTYDGELVYSTTVIPTAGSLFYQVGLDLSGFDEVPDPIGAIHASWLPTTIFLLQQSNGVVDINVAITLQNKDIEAIQARIYDSNGCYYKEHIYTSWTDGNTAVFNIDVNDGTGTNIYTGINCIFDSNANLYSIFVRLDVNSVDGNLYSIISPYWQIVQIDNYQWNLLYRLGITADVLNPAGSKTITSIIAFFIMFLVIWLV